MSKDDNNNSQSTKYSQISNENDIIEQIINNPLLLKDIEGLEEEEEEEDSYSEKDKITEEILDNKLSFIIPEENQQKEKEEKSNTSKKQSKIHKDIIENLLIDLFEYHYTEISKEKKINLGNKIFESKYHIEYFCKNLNKNFSKYILLILEQKIYELIEYVEKIIDEKVKSVKDILEIKNSLKLTGDDIVKIFDKPFQNTMIFDIASVLIVLFISDILSDNKINLTDEEYDQVVQAESFDEKDRFEKYIEECKLYFEKIENGENEEDVEVYYEEKENEESTDFSQNNHKNNNEEKSNEKIKEEKKDKENIIEKNEENKEKNESKEIIKNNEEKKDIFIIEDLNEKKNINSIIEEKNKNKSSNNNINDNDKNAKNNFENKVEKYSNIEDLVKYINGNENKKKRKKKKKKKTKVNQMKKAEEEKENNKIEKDEVFENFKSNLIKFSDSLVKVKKIKPKISEAFIEKLKLIN